MGGLERALQVVREHGVVRSREFDALGIGREYLRLLTARGDLMRLSRGVYVAADAGITAHHALALAARRVPSGVVCLLSALSFHEIGTQLPWQVWMALGGKSHLPCLDYPPLRIVRFSPLALREGVKIHDIEGVPVKITSPARTVVDCFRYRNKIGIDVALEALREGLRPRVGPGGKKMVPLCTRTEIERLAHQMRAASVMRPYLEAFSAF